MKELMLNLGIIIIRKGPDKEMEEENQEQEYENVNC